MQTMASSQKPSRRAKPGSARCVTAAKAKSSQLPDRDEMEDADEVVGGRVVGALLVVVVEAVELGHDHPGRQADEEDEQLDLRADRVGAAVHLEEERRREERERQPDEVGQHEHAPHEPAAAYPDGARPPPLEDLQRPWIEGRRDFRCCCRVDVGLDRVHLRGTPPRPRTTGRTCRIHHSPSEFWVVARRPLLPDERRAPPNLHPCTHASNERMDGLTLRFVPGRWTFD